MNEDELKGKKGTLEKKSVAEMKKKIPQMGIEPLTTSPSKFTV